MSVTNGHTSQVKIHGKLYNNPIESTRLKKIKLNSPPSLEGSIFINLFILWQNVYSHEKYKP